MTHKGAAFASASERLAPPPTVDGQATNAFDRGRLVQARRQRLDAEFASVPFDAFLAVSPANIDYAIGYRSVASEVHRTSTLGALVSPGTTVVAGPSVDAPSAVEIGVDADDYVAHGRFFFESSPIAPKTATGYSHDSFVNALVAAFERAGLVRSTVGIDESGLLCPDREALEAALPNATFVDAAAWALRVRRAKLPEEVERLRAAAAATEAAIHRAIDVAADGMRETDLQHIVATSLTSAGVSPRFVVASVGLRSAFADTPASPDQTLRRGDLVRFDVGGQLDGYWSDLGRTAIAGEPDDLQRERYEAIWAGEHAQIQYARPGVSAGKLFEVAVTEVEGHGLTPYRRHHCGHGIGLNAYEPPIIGPGGDQALEAGMVLCLETPYYELGWGGMMVEDTVLITENGCELLSVSDRSLRIIE